MLAETFKGPIALAFGFEDQVSPAKALAAFIKEAKKGEVIAAALDGKYYRQQMQKHWQIFLHAKKFMQKCLVASIHLHQVSQMLLTA